MLEVKQVLDEKISPSPKGDRRAHRHSGQSQGLLLLPTLSAQRPRLGRHPGVLRGEQAAVRGRRRSVVHTTGTVFNCYFPQVNSLAIGIRID